MKTGPWTDYKDACRYWHIFIRVRSIDGRKPVATERRGKLVRLLYALPVDGRESTVFVNGLPEYISLEGMHA